MSRDRHLACCLLPVGLFAAGAHAQTLRFQAAGTSQGEGFGTAIAWIEDLDGDGITDLAAGAPGASLVRILSGVDLALLLEIRGAAGSRFGAAIAAIADLDGDGLEDLAISVPEADHSSPHVELRSSANGALLREFALGGSWRGGTALARIGDVDGDGFDEIAWTIDYEAFGWREFAELPGNVVEVVSTRDGRVVASLPGEGAPPYYVRAVGVGDHDGDAARDLLLTRRRELDGSLSWPGGPEEPTAVLRSGRDLSELLRIELRNEFGNVIRAAGTAAGDVDGDGVGDFAFVDPGAYDSHAWYEPPFDSQLWICSGSSGDVLHYWRSETVRFTGAIAPAGDVDGDGLDELAVGVVEWLWLFDFAKYVAVLDPRSGRVVRKLDLELAPSYDHVGNYVLLGGRDLDGDAAPDLAVGDTIPGPYRLDGRVRTAAPAREEWLHERLGVDSQHEFTGGVAFVDDLDGDGAPELAVGEVHGGSQGAVAVLSGRDGSLLRRIEPEGLDTDFGRAVVAVPDLDGDSIGEIAVAGRGRVEVRSGASGALLRTLEGSLDDVPVTALAVGIQPDGRAELAAGVPATLSGIHLNGSVALFDLHDGRSIRHLRSNVRGERLGTSVAYLGDVNGNGFGDWAAGAPQNDQAGANAGRVVLLDGRHGVVFAELLGDEAAMALGVAVAALGDVDGDAAGDLLVGLPGGANGHGAVRAYSGATLARLASWFDAGRYEMGNWIAVPGDVNGDGSPELAFGFSVGADRYVEIVEYRTGLELARIHSLQWSFGRRLATLPPWRPRHREPALLAIGAPEWYFHDDTAFRSGTVHCYELPGLFLRVVPQVASTGERVRGIVSAGPPGALTGIYLAELDGTPYEEFLDFGWFDALGVFVDWSVVPPGLEGTKWLLRAYAVGFDGRLARSSDVTLRFE